MIESNIRESDVTRAIVEGFMNKLIDHAETDVVIVGGGPSGTIAAMLLAREGVKTTIIEKDIKAGGGMWQGGMLFPKLVVEQPAADFLEGFGMKLEKHPKGFFTADSYYVSAKLLSLAFEYGATMFNSVQVQDVIYGEKGLRGVVVNWQPVAHLTAACVDPLGIESKIVIDATGHDATVARAVAQKIGLKEFVGHEGSMWIEKAEQATIENTKEIYPNLIVAGMAANSVFGLPRMGPVFGGMFLSGAKAAQLALAKLGKTSFTKNNIPKETLKAISR